MLATLLLSLLVQQSAVVQAVPAQPAATASTDEETAPPQPAPGGSYRLGPGAGTYKTGPGLAPAPQLAPSGGYRLGPGLGTYNIAPGLAPAPPRVEATGVTIENYDRRIESRFGTPDPFYEATVRGGAALAQGRQGALDGGWILSGPDGEGLYALQLVDKGEGGSLEGAWRGLGASSSRQSGFIALIGRESGRTVLRFLEPGARAPTVVTLEPTADGSWRGRLQRAEAGASPLVVVMRRRRP